MHAPRVVNLLHTRTKQELFNGHTPWLQAQIDKIQPQFSGQIPKLGAAAVDGGRFARMADHLPNPIFLPLNVQYGRNDSLSAGHRQDPPAAIAAAVGATQPASRIYEEARLGRYIFIDPGHRFKIGCLGENRDGVNDVTRFPQPPPHQED